MLNFISSWLTGKGKVPFQAQFIILWSLRRKLLNKKTAKAVFLSLVAKQDSNLEPS